MGGNFNLEEFLANDPEYAPHAAKIVGMGADGKPRAQLKDGQEISIDVNTIMAKYNQDPKDWNVEFNRPESAIPYSPLSTKERAMWSLDRNQQTFAKALMNSFEDVKQDAHGGFLVKNKGMWQQVDPDFFDGSDPWALAKNIVGIVKAPFSKDYAVKDQLKKLPGDVAETGVALAKGLKTAATEFSPIGIAHAMATGRDLPHLNDFMSDVAESGPTAAMMTADVVGFAAGGIPGAVAASGAMSVVLSVLGKLVGTYNATPEEMAKEAGIDMLFTLGGRTLQAGARPTIQKFREVATAIKDKASPMARQTLAKWFGQTARMGDDAAGILFNQTDDFFAHYNQIQSQAGTSNWKKVVETALNDAGDAMRGSLKRLKEAPSRIFGEEFRRIKDVFRASGKQVAVTATETIDDMANAMEQSGLLKKEVVSGAGLTDDVVKYRPYTADEWASRVGTTPTELPMGVEREAVESIWKEIQSLRNGRVLTDDAAINFIRALDERVGKIISSIGDSTVPEIKRFKAIIRTAKEQALAKQFEKTGVLKEMGDLRTNYHANVDKVDSFSRLLVLEDGTAKIGAPQTVMKKAFSLNPEEGIEVRKLMFGNLSDPSHGLTLDKGSVFSLLPDGADVVRRLRLNNAVARSAPTLSTNLYRAVTAGGLAATTAAVNPMVGGVVATGGLVSMSPRAARGIAAMGVKTANALRSLDKNLVQELIKDHSALQEVLYMSQRAAGTSNNLTQQILKGATGGM